MSAFWRGWLNVWCLLVFVFGLVLAGGGLAATSGPSEMLFGVLGGQLELTWTPHLRFSVALMGAVTMGWAVTFFAAFSAAHRLGDQAAIIWRWITGSLLVWFVVDSALSVATGFALNAVSNAGLLVGYLIPVLASGALSRAR